VGPVDRALEQGPLTQIVTVLLRDRAAAVVLGDLGEPRAVTASEHQRPVFAHFPHENLLIPMTLARPRLMASSKPLGEVALVSTTLATGMSPPFV